MSAQRTPTSRSPDEEDAAYLERAIELATANVSVGGGPFGAVVVRGRAVVATGANRVVADLDPTAHAEVVAIRAACQAAASYDLTGCTLYASCEPCPLCLAAAMWARIDRIVFSATRDDAAAAGFDDARFYRELTAPPEERSFQVERVALEAAARPFDAWANLADRQRY